MRSMAGDVAGVTGEGGGGRGAVKLMLKAASLGQRDEELEKKSRAKEDADQVTFGLLQDPS